MLHRYHHLDSALEPIVPEGKQPKRKVFFSNPNSDRRHNCPKTRWIDLVEADVWKLKIPEYETIAPYRLSWKRYVDETNSTN